MQCTIRWFSLGSDRPDSFDASLEGHAIYSEGFPSKPKLRKGIFNNCRLEVFSLILKAPDWLPKALLPSKAAVNWYIPGLDASEIFAGCEIQGMTTPP